MKLFRSLIVGVFFVANIVSLIPSISANRPEADLVSTLTQLWHNWPTSEHKSSHFKNILSFAIGDRDTTDFGNVELCGRNLVDLSIGLVRRDAWAIKILDAASKIPSGILEGNVIDVGSYDECLSVETNQGFNGQYCLYKLLFHYRNESANPFRRVILGGETRILLSICLPSTCAPSLIRFLLNKTLTEFTHNRDVVISFDIPEGNCHTKAVESKPINLAEWIALLIALLILSLVVISTYLHVYRSNDGESLCPYVGSFSLKKNWKSLFNTERKSDTVKILYGFRFLNTFWIILANRYQFFADLPVINAFHTLDLFKQWSTMIILSVPLAADSYLFIGGLLNSFATLKLFNQNRGPLVFANLVFRYIKITIPFAVIQAVIAIFLNRLSDGPLWNKIVSPEIENCQNYWYTGLIYISNYYNPNNICLKQSWYLSVYMQLFLLSPLILYPLSKYPFVGKILLAASLAISVLIPTYAAYANDIRYPITISRNETLVNFENRVNFIPTHVRFSSYLVGLACGYFLFQMNQNDKRLQLRWICRTFVCVISCILSLTAVFGCYWIYQMDRPYNRIYSSLYMGLHRLAWTLGIAWLIVSSILSKKGILSRFLSSKLFIPLGRLTYSLYLIYMVVLLYEFGTVKSPFYYSFVDTLHSFFGDLIVDFLLAFILYMTVERPVCNLINILKCRLFET